MPLNLHFDASINSCLLFLQKAVSAKSRDASWIAAVHDVIAELEALNHTTEADFLAVGGKLLEFLTTSRQLHSELDKLIALTGGEQVRNACNVLVSVRAFAGETEQRSEDEKQAFLKLQSSGARIQQGFSMLGQIARSFQITAILARIEAAHLVTSKHETGDLADQVQACSNGIQSSADEVMKAAAAFHSRLAATLQEAATYEATQKQQLSALLTAVEADLQSLEARQQEAVKVSAQVTTDLKSVTRDLEAIGTSIQSHDITRQQIEHVVEALREMERHASKRALTPQEASLMRVQKAQLASAAAAFCLSVNKIDSDLQRISGQVEAMASASRSTAGLDHDGKDSSLVELRNRLNGVLQTIRDLGSSQLAARATVVDVERLSQELRTSVKAVQKIELQLSRISINGIIAASEIGFLGQPLSVVAEAMQALQIECTSRSQAATEEVDAIAGSLKSLAVGSDSGQQFSRDALLTDLRQRIDDLGSAGTASADLARNVASLAETLRDKVQEARRHVVIGQTFAETAARCGGLLESLAADAKPLWSLHSKTADVPLEERYTMQSERDIHAAILKGGGATMSASSVVSVEEPSTATDMTEEVEFF